MSSITHDIIETAVFCALKSNVKIVSYKLKPFSKNRNGIMGSHYIAVVEVEQSKNSAPMQTLRFFIKTPPDSQTLRNTIMDDWVFNEEIYFFDKVYSLLMQDYKCEKWSPACYLAKPEILVLEDLRFQGYAVRQNTIFDKESLKSVLSTLARFHASSIIAEARLGEPLNKIYPNAFREKIFTDVGKGGRSNKLGFHTLEMLAERFDLDGSIVPKILNRICEIVKFCPNKCNAVCHGDLWKNNIMFKDDDTLIPKCVLVDYQMLRYASPTIDVAMLSYVHTTSEFRKDSELQMLEHYYSILRETLELCNDEKVDSKIPTYQTIREDYEERKIIGMAYSCMRWPVQVTASRDDPEALEKWYFHNRIDTYRSIMDADPVYESMMKDYLKEMLDEGKRILNLI